MWGELADTVCRIGALSWKLFLFLVLVAAVNFEVIGIAYARVWWKGNMGTDTVMVAPDLPLPLTSEAPAKKPAAVKENRDPGWAFDDLEKPAKSGKQK